MTAVGLPGPQCASFQAPVSSAASGARPESKHRGAKHVFLLCEVLMRIVNSFF